jgi:branched-chain amino acid aminotransferase
VFYINGSYIQDEEAKISALDLGIVRGYGVFDYLRTYGGRPFHLTEHLLRLQFSAEYVGITLPKTIAEIEEIIITLLKQKTWNRESSVKIIVTGGTSIDHFLPDENPSLLIHVYPCNPFPEACYEHGIRVVTTRHMRTVPMSKTLHYTPAIMALRSGRGIDALEALYVNSKEEILEATTSNFFAFKNGELITPESEEILLGITREIALGLAQGHFPINIRPITLSEIPDFDEAFISSSTKEILPVIQIDGKQIGDGKVGEKTRKLMQFFKDYTNQEQWPELPIPRYDRSLKNSLSAAKENS